MIGLGITAAAAGLVYLRVDVAIGNEEVQIGVVVVVEEISSEADERQAGLNELDACANSGEAAVALVAVECIVLAFKMAD